MKTRAAEVMGRALALAFLLNVPSAGVCAEGNDDPIPSLSVTGRADASAPPDQAIVRAGASVQARDAASAQKQVNQTMHTVIENIRKAGVPEKQIRTTGLTLSPVYGPRNRLENDEPHVVGYRAGNIVEVTLDDVAQVGRVFDVAVNGGANQIEGISFRIKNDRPLRERALTEAISEARSKARVMAEASNVKLGEILEVAEGGVNVVRPHMEVARFGLAAADMGTPVSPGEVRVDATVTVRFRLRDN